jgi:hypothetical protein
MLILSDSASRCGVVAALALVFSGCVPIATETSVATMTVEDLCVSIIVARNLGNAKGKALALTEVERRGGFAESDLRYIRTNTVAPGMTERGAVCAWGNAYDAVNVTTTARGSSKQYVYSSDYAKTRYFYTENGRVTAVQM